MRQSAQAQLLTTVETAGEAADQLTQSAKTALRAAEIMSAAAEEDSEEGHLEGGRSEREAAAVAARSAVHTAAAALQQAREGESALREALDALKRRKKTGEEVGRALNSAAHHVDEARKTAEVTLRKTIEAANLTAGKNGRAEEPADTAAPLAAEVVDAGEGACSAMQDAVSVYEVLGVRQTA